MITGGDDAANNFARGYYTQGKSMLPRVNQRIRKLVESCEFVQGFIMYHSLGGGTGSGLTALLFERIADDFKKKTVLELPIYPSPNHSTAVVEPYNSILMEHYSMEYCDLSFILDNEALYGICSNGLTIKHPTYHQVNRIIAQFCSALTTAMCFEGSLSTDISQLQTNLVPFPRIHFPLANYGPILTFNKADHQGLTVKEITSDVFNPMNQMVKLDPQEGKYMSCCLLYRGDVSPQDANVAITLIKNQKVVRFVDWCPTAFKVAISSMPPTVTPNSEMAPTTRNITLLTNTSSIGQPFQRLINKFNHLYSKRSFVHWFVGEGMEEGDFNDSSADIIALIEDYAQCGTDAEETSIIGTSNSSSSTKKLKSQQSVPESLLSNTNTSNKQLLGHLCSSLHQLDAQLSKYNTETLSEENFGLPGISNSTKISENRKVAFHRLKEYENMIIAAQ